MAPRNTVDEGNPGPDESREDAVEPKPSEEPQAASEPPRKKIRIVDGTGEGKGIGIAIIGGVRAPRPRN